ncbi:MAG: sialidase family protein [Verrucomicrobiota bacterium]
MKSLPFIPPCFVATLSVFLCFAPARGAAAQERAPAAPFFEILPQPILTGLIHLPGLLVTEADTVLLIAQSRVKKGDFDPSDVVLTRSTDQGKTWSAPLKIFASEGSGRIGYSCVLVEDRTTTPRAILAYYTVGPAPWKSHQLVWFGRRSTDEGLTWGEPFEVKSDGHPESKPSNGGHGFQFANGRLVIPGRGNFLYSDDHGVSWTTAGKAETVETKVLPVAQADGSEANAVYLVTRRSTKYRIYEAFGEKLMEEGDHGNIYTTLGRNPGLARYSTKRDGAANVMLMSGIPDMKNRVFSITYSLDEGRTWSNRKKIDDVAWYSDLGVTKNKTIIAAYTVAFSADLKIARFNLPWIMQEGAK